jgi:lysozyme
VSAAELAVARLKTDEGFRSSKYLDTRGHTTIGYGFDVDAGISEYAAAALLTAQTEERAQALGNFWWAKGLDDPRMSVVIEVAFNDGLSGLLHFVNMLSALGTGRWNDAQAQLLDSDAARELPARYQRLGQILLTGTA